VRTLSRVALAIVIPLLLMCAWLTPQLARGSRIEPFLTSQVLTVPEDVAPSSTRDQGMIDGDGPVDLYGNEVTAAVAKYKLDATGSLYETHSPQTELPRLGSPKS